MKNFRKKIAKIAGTIMLIWTCLYLAGIMSLSSAIPGFLAPLLVVISMYFSEEYDRKKADKANKL